MAPPYKTFCYALAIVHIISASCTLLFATVGFSQLDEIAKKGMEQLQPEQATPEAYDTMYKVLVTIFIIADIVAVSQIFVGVSCIIGIHKQLPDYVRRFRINAIVCLVLMGLGILTSIGNPSRLLFQLPSVAFFAVEVWVAGKCYDIMLEENRQKGNNAGPNQAMLV